MESTLVISSFPPHGVIHAKQTVGGAAYVANLLYSLKNYSFEVWAESLESIPDKVKHKNVQILRIWKRNSLLLLPLLAIRILKTKHKKIVLSFEAYQFGSLLAWIPVFIAAYLHRFLFKTEVITLAQHVATSTTFVDKNLIERKITTLLSKLLNLLISFTSSKIIVHESFFVSNFNESKTKYLPHLPYCPIDIKPLKKKKHKHLNILFFGYISPYKGILEFLESWESSSEHKLTIAGGLNPNYLKSETHLKYFNKVKRLANLKRVTMLGFVNESMIADIFDEADLLLLPYTKIFSSSGPLSFAKSYKVLPFFHRVFKKIYPSLDKRLFFEFKSDAIAEKLNQINLNFDEIRSSYFVDANKVSNFNSILNEYEKTIFS